MQFLLKFLWIACLALCFSAWADSAQADDVKGNSKDSPVKALILPGESFLLEGHPAFILWPEEAKRQNPQPWILYSPTLPAYPDSHEKWMHEQFLNAGIAVAGIDSGESYGSPKGRAAGDALYGELTGKRGFAKRLCVLGRSRGGLWASSWAIENPEKVAGIAGIYPVFDFRTYPGLDKAAPAYDLTGEQLAARAAEFNPIERLSVLAKAKIPALLIHGEDDKVVPIKENSSAFVALYEAAGAGNVVKLIAVPGQGHNFWEGFFHCQELVDFCIAHAKEGATKQK